MNRIRLAVVGAGLIGQTHLAIINDSAECELVAICDANPAAAATAENYNVPFYQEHTRLLAEETLDGVIVATPTDLHAEVGIACAQSGIHYLVEKPIASTLTDSQEMIAAAERCNAQILVGHHRRHNPLVQAARQIVQSGEIGQLVAVSAQWLLQKPEPYFDVAWRRALPGGGPALINLIHDIDTLRYICGEVQQIFATTTSATRGFEVEDTLSVNVTFADGALGSIIASDAAPAPWSYELTTGENPAYPQQNENCYHFCGTKGSLSFPRMSVWHYPNAEKSGWWHPIANSARPVEPADPLVIQLAHFCRVIRGEEAPLVSGEEGFKTLAVTQAIRESAARQRPIDPTELYPATS